MKIGITLTVLFFFIFPSLSAGEEGMKGPWEPKSFGNGNHGQSEGAAQAGPGLVRLYRAYLSPIDGSRCAMHPSCSEYSIQAFEKHGFFMGWVMTMDRLFRCGRDELRRSPWVIVDDEPKCYDPLDKNDFWWHP